MSAQLAPALSQRCHWRAYVMVGVPVHVPSSPVSVNPSSAAPEMPGATASAGAAGGTTALTADGALAAPATLDAVTTTRSVWSTSAGVCQCVVAVSPGMSAQFVPSASQRCHWWANETTGVPVHVPSEATASSCPSPSVPLSAGAAVLAGGAGTTAVGGPEVAPGLPPALGAVTCMRSAWPTSAGTRA